MDIILYNPLSNKGKNVKIAEKLAKQGQKQGRMVTTMNLLDIKDVKEFLSIYQKEDKIIIIGGDGTLNRIVNQIDGFNVLPEAYIYKAGSGNDFIRTVKVNKNLADIKPYIKKLPTLYVNGKVEKFINGAGVGLDGLVCYKVNKSKAVKNKSNYFKNAVSSFFNYKPVAGKITVDGKTWEEKKLWFATAMFSSYFGGGMKLAPKKKRTENNLELVIVRNIPKWLLVLVFPTIYLGWHPIFKKYVKFYRGNDITVEFEKPSYLQRDGEDEYPVLKYRVTMEK